MADKINKTGCVCEKYAAEETHP